MNIINVNGRRYEIPDGASVSVINGQLIVNGSVCWEDDALKQCRVEITGNVGNVHTDHAPVSITGDVHGSVEAGGSITCKLVSGDVNAGGSVTCGMVNGSVEAGGSVTCGNVGGDIDAGGSVRHR